MSGCLVRPLVRPAVTVARKKGSTVWRESNKENETMIEVGQVYVRARNAARRFARLNGWGQSGGFTMWRLAGLRGRRFEDDAFPLWYSGSDAGGPLMDHVYYFTAQRRPITIVTMPYHADLEDVREIADRYGLDVLAPPIAKSGWWLPGWTFCFAFVRPGTTVKWLPQQST
jgi:hypothetical protein